MFVEVQIMILNKQNLSENKELSQKVDYHDFTHLPERIIQFGGGNFIRAFSDWMINELNKQELFNGRIVLVQATPSGKGNEINEQDGLYTVIVRGMKDGKIVDEPNVVSSISRCINPYTEWEEYLKCARDINIKYVFSNTTEAGIVYNPEEKFDEVPISSFPGKLTKYLYERYQYFNGSKESGMVIFPCELIERNGDQLKNIILKISESWGLPDGFSTWINEHNGFFNTLVDRITPGYPKEDAKEVVERLGYEDKLMTTAECFYLWVLEGPLHLKECIPFNKGGLNAIWTNDVYPYKTRKVRMLNGIHIATVPVGLLYGIETVGECIEHSVIGSFMRNTVYNEIIPSIEGVDKSMLVEFGNSMVDRFRNPYIKHKLMTISLNSISKFRERIIPSIIGYKKATGTVPENLAFSFAALIAFYKGEEIRDNLLICKRGNETYEIKDEPYILEFFKNAWSTYDPADENSLYKVVESVLQNKRLWDMDLLEAEGLYEKVSENLMRIMKQGVKKAISV